MNMNVSAWLDRRPVVMDLTPHMVTSSHTSALVGEEEFLTELERWEYSVTLEIWSMIDSKQKCEEIRNFLLRSAHQTIQGVVVKTGVPMMGYARAVTISYQYRGHYHRTQVFHIPL